jgi:hypothetical protein
MGEIYKEQSQIYAQFINTIQISGGKFSGLRMLSNKKLQNKLCNYLTNVLLQHPVSLGILTLCSHLLSSSCNVIGILTFTRLPYLYFKTIHVSVYLTIMRCIRCLALGTCFTTFHFVNASEYSRLYRVILLLCKCLVYL